MQAEITAYTRTGFARHFELRDVVSREIADLTGFSFLFTVKATRDQASPSVEASLANGRITIDDDGMGFTLDLPGAAFSAMAPGRYLCALVCYAPGGGDETLLEGRLTLVKSL